MSDISCQSIIEVETPRVYPYLMSDDGKFFEVVIHVEDASFNVIDMTVEEIERFMLDIKEQLYLITDYYKRMPWHDSSHTTTE